MGTPLKIALIAGEISGDQLGGWLMQSLKQADPAVAFIGVGGERMQEQGLKSLFPIQEISLMGVFEILPHVFSLKRRIRETIAYLKAERPDILVTIDSPGFNFRIAKALRNTGKDCPRLIHYVAPSVWSHRPGRAKKVAKLYDHLLVIFPFEPPYFEREGLKTSFIGHQVAWEWRTGGVGAAFRARHAIAVTAPVLAVFPGSRNAELDRMLPAISGAVTILSAQVPGLHVVVQVPESLKARLERETAHWPNKPLVLSNREEKKDFFAAATAALAKSGTVALECAFAGLPAVVTYKANPISVWIVRKLALIRYVHIANLMADREIIPELIQERCTAAYLSTTLQPLLTDETARHRQRDALAAFAGALGAADTQSPSDKAARIILSGLEMTDSRIIFEQGQKQA